MKNKFRIYIICVLFFSILLEIEAYSKNKIERVSIEIVSEPEFADVYIDGKFYGISPLQIHDMEIGEHDIELIHPLYGRKDSKINVKHEGEKVKIDIYKKKIEPVFKKNTNNQQAIMPWKIQKMSKQKKVFSYSILSSLVIIASVLLYKKYKKDSEGLSVTLSNLQW